MAEKSEAGEHGEISHTKDLGDDAVGGRHGRKPQQSEADGERVYRQRGKRQQQE